MRVAFAVAVAVALFTGTAVGRSQESDAQRKGSITLSGVVLGVRHADSLPIGRSVGDTTSWVVRLQRRDSSTVVGYYALVCVLLGVGGVYGNGVSDCTMTISLPLGKIRAGGVRHNKARFYLMVTGGTGFYRGGRGTVFSRSEGPGRSVVAVLLS